MRRHDPPIAQARGCTLILPLMHSMYVSRLPAHVAHRLQVLRRRQLRTIASYGYYRGHLVVCFAGEDDTCERYASDLTRTVGEDGAGIERPCVRCHALAQPDGPDPCLGLLPGVVSACCGHGVEEPYILFRVPRPGTERGTVLRGEHALRYFTHCGVGPHAPPHGCEPPRSVSSARRDSPPDAPASAVVQTPEASPTARGS